ncbi:FGFR1 oncogene partner 2 homolog [Drosophila madeirensis]|uniref:FGFR1 oncogene partner 2 homolog n=1 Tax=Drosophila madeirensis TaxID=30013 RepID=A0AAU9F926_DROMD
MNYAVKSTDMSTLIQEASNLTDGFGELIVQIDGLLHEALIVDSKIVDSCKYRDEQLIKHLAEHSKDETQALALRENMELKATVEEYHNSIQTIVAKYKEHCQGDMLLESYNIREKYMAGLEQIVNGQGSRIDLMSDMMKALAHMSDLEGEENQELIRRLCGENEMMRRQLQISHAGSVFSRGPNATNESATQFDRNDWNPDDSSMDSFLSCLSHGGEESDSSSSSSSVISQAEVNRFIQQVLGEDITDESDSSSELE